MNPSNITFNKSKQPPIFNFEEAQINQIPNRGFDQQEFVTFFLHSPNTSMTRHRPPTRVVKEKTKRQVSWAIKSFMRKKMTSLDVVGTSLETLP